MTDCPNNCWLNGKPKGEHYPSCPFNLQARTAAMLRSLEWRHCSENWGPACPVCGGHKDHGHHGEKVNVNMNPPCTLAALLRELP